MVYIVINKKLHLNITPRNIYTAPPNLYVSYAELDHGQQLYIYFLINYILFYFSFNFKQNNLHYFDISLFFDWAWKTKSGEHILIPGNVVQNGSLRCDSFYKTSISKILYKTYISMLFASVI